MKGKALKTALTTFTHAMEKRLTQKQSQGFTGWDTEGFEDWNIPRRLYEKANKVLGEKEKIDRKHLVDIANFAMFLWSKIETCPLKEKI